MIAITAVFSRPFIVNSSNNTNQEQQNQLSFLNVQTYFLIDSNVIVHFTNEFPTFKRIKKNLVDFYKNRNGEPYWIMEGKLSKNGIMLLTKLNQLEEEGLKNNSYINKKTDSLLKSIEVQPTNTSTAEIMLTCRYLQMASNVWFCMNVDMVKQLKWNIPLKKWSINKILNQLTEHSDWYTKPPVVEEYEKLKAYLNKYQYIKKNRKPYKIKSNNKLKVTPGQKDTIIAITRSYLNEFGFLRGDNSSEIFDSSFKIGLHTFQNRIGLAESDVLTNSEIQEMNISIDDRINQIRTNMERLRWLPLYDNEEKIIINIPEFKLHYYKDDNLQFSMKVIIGKTFQPTAVFKGELQEIILCPYWNIPPSILHKEILPALSKNKSYLQQNNMEWFGSGIRQRPGNDNALGTIKFIFPNRYNIYMHDTPNKYLFNKNIRTFSHGCIRLENARKLAIYLLRNTKEWNATSIDEFIQKKKETKIKLHRSIPVYIVYRTAWVDKDGQLNFRKDIYGKDKLLLKCLDKKTTL